MNLCVCRWESLYWSYRKELGWKIQRVKKGEVAMTDEQSPGSANVMNISTCKRPEELGRGMVSVRHWLNGSHALAAALWGYSDNRRWRKPSTVICLSSLRWKRWKNEGMQSHDHGICSPRAKNKPTKTILLSLQNRRRLSGLNTLKTWADVGTRQHRFF